MKKIFKKIILFIIVVAALYGIGRLIDVSYGSYQFVSREPYMVMQTANSITIKWQSPQKEKGKVLYGLSADNLTQNIEEKESLDKHSVTLDHLKECTKYYYNVVSSSLNIDNKGRSFKTLCDKTDAQRIWVVGDSGKKGQKQKQVHEQMLHSIDNNLSNLDMWILLGDNAYKSGTQKQYNKALFEPYRELIKRFSPLAVIGNHDARRWAFYDIFDFPTHGESGGIPSGYEEFYSIDSGNLHLVMLDSETVDRDSDGKMAQWLRKDLQANTKPWIIVAFHTPPYTDGGHKSDNAYDSGGRMKDMRENFVPIFDEFGVDLVLSGHSHGYERSKLIIAHTGTSNTFSEKNIVENTRSSYTKPLQRTKNSGTIYLVCGSSSKLDKATLKHPALPFSHQKLGSLILEITPNSLTSKFITINGKIADKFTINKIDTQSEHK